MKARIVYICALFLIVLIASCAKNHVIEENYDFKEGLWHQDSLASFSFIIDDTTTTYDLSYNVRYAVDYPYYNLYLTYFLEDSTSTNISSEMQEIILFDKKTGDPLGNGVGDLFDREVLIFEKKTFKSTGMYSFKAKQFMRNEELSGMYSFGLKIKKSEN